MKLWNLFPKMRNIHSGKHLGKSVHDADRRYRVHVL